MSEDKLLNGTEVETKEIPERTPVDWEAKYKEALIELEALTVVRDQATRDYNTTKKQLTLNEAFRKKGFDEEETAFRLKLFNEQFNEVWAEGAELEAQNQQKLEQLIDEIAFTFPKKHGKQKRKITDFLK